MAMRNRGAALLRHAAIIISTGMGLQLANAVQVSAPISGQGTWLATLAGRDLDGNAANGFEAYYDSDLNITWLADANYAASHGTSRDGRLTWDSAVSWVNALSVSGVSGWRLPRMLDTGLPGCNRSNNGTDCGYNVQTKSSGIVYSELAHLYLNILGNTGQYGPGGVLLSNYGLRNSGPFNNLTKVNGASIFWFGQQDQADQRRAWVFDMIRGSQDVAAKTGLSTANQFYAWAVHDGDVGQASAVPEPEAILLALAGLAVVIRKKGAIAYWK
jgi:hypothetical protein